MATRSDESKPVLEGDEAQALYEEIVRREEIASNEALARAKADAAARGKEPFDLEKLEKLCDTSSEGRLAPLEERRADFEYQYYVNRPSVMTIGEFAALIEERNKW